MKEVKIVHVKGKEHFFKTVFDYEDIIKELYQKGYELKTAIPAAYYGYGSVCEMDLVFEREV